MPSYEAVTQRAGSWQARAGITTQEFEALLAHVERALVAYLQDRTSDGHPRTSRRYSAYANGPLTHHSRQTARHSDVCAAESHSRSARTTLGEVPIKRE
jgi:hypothetical protein